MIFEWAYAGLRRTTEVVEERDREFPSWRRRDAKSWARWKFYPGVFLTLIFKLTSIFAILFAIMAYLKFVFTLHGDKMIPLEGWKLFTTRKLYRFFAYYVIFCHGYWMTTIKHGVEDVDYSKYLGPDWKKDTLKCKKVSM